MLGTINGRHDYCHMIMVRMNQVSANIVPADDVTKALGSQKLSENRLPRRLSRAKLDSGSC